MAKTLSFLLKKLDIDQGTAFTLITRFYQIFVGIITLVVVTQYLTPALQGFYYTFASIVALQTFFELGFSIVIVNTASHEWSKLSYNERGKIEGDPSSLSRLASLARLILKWYLIISTLFILATGTGGYLFFFSSTEYPNINWQLPWLVLILFSGLLLITMSFISLLEGCNQIVEVNKLRLKRSFLAEASLWLTLIWGGNLWAAAIASIVRFFCEIHFILSRYKSFFHSLWAAEIYEQLDWKTEIWPMQWRVGFSGLVNYFAFSLFNPVMFHYHGSVVAGQMGMTWSIVSALQLIALAWINTKIPQFGILIAKRNFLALDKLWFRVSSISLFAISIIAISTWSGLYLIHHFKFSIAQRILSPLPVALFFIATFFMQISQCLTAYLRAHKKEPIIVMSITISLLIGFLVWKLGSRFGPTGSASAYLSMNILLVIWESLIWQKCRKKWHHY